MVVESPGAGTAAGRPGTPPERPKRPAHPHRQRGLPEGDRPGAFPAQQHLPALRHGRLEREHQHHRRHGARAHHPGPDHPLQLFAPVPLQREPGHVPRQTGAAGRQRRQHAAHPLPGLQHQRFRGRVPKRRRHARQRRAADREPLRPVRRQSPPVHLHRPGEHVHGHHFRENLPPGVPQRPFHGLFRLRDRHVAGRQHALGQRRLVRPLPGAVLLPPGRARAHQKPGGLGRLHLLLPRPEQRGHDGKGGADGHHPERLRPGRTL